MVKNLEKETLEDVVEEVEILYDDVNEISEKQDQLESDLEEHKKVIDELIHYTITLEAKINALVQVLAQDGSLDFQELESIVDEQEALLMEAYQDKK